MQTSLHTNCISLNSELFLIKFGLFWTEKLDPDAGHL